MLLKLTMVDEIGRFATLRHNAPEFSRLTLVFARNGYGKSTVCAILRSASAEQPKEIFARRRLAAQKESRVALRWDGKEQILFSDGKWNICPGKVYVFDQEFVQQNLHVGDSVTRDNKRSLLPVVLGDQGVVLARKILDLDREQRDLDMDMKKHSAIVYAKCPVISSADILAFCTREIPEDIASRVETAERGVQLAKLTLAVQQKGKPRLIEIPSIEKFREIASRTIASVSLDVGARVREHIDARALGSRGHQWLKFGFEHLNGDICPFCDQQIGSLELLATYEAYFSESFGQLLVDRDAAITALDQFVADNAINTLVDANEADFMFWENVCDLSVRPTMDVDRISSILAGLRMLRLTLEKKMTNPLIIAEFGDQECVIKTAFDAITAYNDDVTTSCIAIDAAKIESRGSDLTKAQKIHSQWQALLARQSDPIKSAADAYVKCATYRREIERYKKVAQSDLTTYAETTMKKRESDINVLLSDFGANFTIVNAKANFKGREPNTEFAIPIGDRLLLVGDKSDTAPSFKTVLSAGDKTTLALAFFITQVLADPNLAQAVVAFDDPFNSQDMSRQFETTSQIRAIAKTACQTIVFSHDPRFLKMIERDADKAVTRTFQLQCADNGAGTIALWSSADELKELYVRQAEMIREYASQGTLLKDATHMSVLQAIRPFLEDYIKARFPGRFAAHEQIVPMTAAIKQAGFDDPLYGSVNDLLALNEYTRPNMHGGGQAPDPVSLRAQTKKIVAIVGRY